MCDTLISGDRMKKFLIRLIVFLLILLLGLAGFLGVRGYSGYKEITSQTPVETVVEQVQSSPTFVPYEDLPSDLIRATVSIEDRRFYEHGGIDYIGLARGTLSQVIPQLAQSGGSTITQQVAKNLYGMFEQTLDRKLVEMFIAKELESKYTKNQILALYVNIINYGDYHFGIYEASTGYFGVEPQYLTLAQASLLAGLPQSPGNYQLSDHFQQAKARQHQVLEAMAECSYINESDIETIYAQDVYATY